MPLAHLTPSSPFCLQLFLFREEHDHMYVKNTEHMAPVVETKIKSSTMICRTDSKMLYDASAIY